MLLVLVASAQWPLDWVNMWIHFFNHWYRGYHHIFKIPPQWLGLSITIYRRAPNLGSNLTKNVIDEPLRKETPETFKGFFKCGTCAACKIASTQKQSVKEVISTVTKRKHRIKESITCNSIGVVYLIQCPCHLQYVGRTIRALKTRLYEHVYKIRRGFEQHNLSLHFKLHHNSDPSLMTFVGLEQVNIPWRGANRTKLISQKESRWIFELNTLTPRGLNVEFDLNCFIDNA